MLSSTSDRRPLVLRYAAFVILLCVVPLSQGFAAGFDVRPVMLETDNGLAAVTVSNPGANRIYVQGTIYGWSYNAAGVGELAVVPDVIVSPPATWIEPGSEYRFRLSVPEASPGDELSYRLLLAEVPTRKALTSGAVVMIVTQSIPIFSQGESIEPASLSATVEDSTLSIYNTGGRHVRVAKLEQDGEVVKSGLLGYALRESRLAIPLTAPIHPGPIEISTDRGQQTIVVSQGDDDA